MRNRLSFLISIALASFTPAWADDAGAGTSGSNKTSVTGTSTSSSKSFVENFPARIVSFVVGTAVGTPIAIVRCTHRELIKQTKECYTLGGMPKPIGWVTTGLMGLPSGVISGVWYGLSDGVADSWVGSKEPFSKDSFSLEKLEF